MSAAATAMRSRVIRPPANIWLDRSRGGSSSLARRRTPTTSRPLTARMTAGSGRRKRPSPPWRRPRRRRRRSPHIKLYDLFCAARLLVLWERGDLVVGPTLRLILREGSGLAHLEGRRGDDACGHGKGRRMRKIHAAKLVAGGIQIGLHAPEGQIQDIGNLIVSFAASGPDQALFFSSGKRRAQLLELSAQSSRRIDKQR